MENQKTETVAWETFAGLPPYRGREAVRGEVCQGGAGLADDYRRATDEDCRLYVISRTNEAEFDAFLREIPMQPVAQEQNEAGRYYTYRGEDALLFVSYFYRDGCVRLVEDRASTVPAEALSLPGGGETVSLYQYSLNYKFASVEYAEPGCMDCGMLYIFRFSDGSLMLIDSAHGVQATRRSQEGLYRFLRKISGTPEGEKIRIRAWFFTHAHGDHCGMAATFFGTPYAPGLSGCAEENYADRVQVDAVLFNFPSPQVAVGTYAPDETQAMKQAMRDNFPDAAFVKLHTGQRFAFLGLQAEVLYTWEDSVLPDGSWGLKEFNSTSTVLRFTYGTHSILLLADTAKASERILLSHYTEKTLRSDVVQVAHHCINKLGIYETVDARYALVPTSRYLMEVQNAEQYACFRDVCTGGCFCADAVTWELAMTPETLTFREHPRYDADDRQAVS